MCNGCLRVASKDVRGEALRLDRPPPAKYSIPILISIPSHPIPSFLPGRTLQCVSSPLSAPTSRPMLRVLRRGPGRYRRCFQQTVPGPSASIWRSRYVPNNNGNPYAGTPEPWDVEVSNPQLDSSWIGSLLCHRLPLKEQIVGHRLPTPKYLLIESCIVRRLGILRLSHCLRLFLFFFFFLPFFLFFFFFFFSVFFARAMLDWHLSSCQFE
ncbi:hypothetical protein BKA59DRAFT_181809 [Fusarium tricinctum]|uniref:Uncharacterized protein n=1 Tax=Fusarium tricinctum TaxID=61284 RepID=A0A8K0WCZ8_9HYPO|nr:hypothetical protein BKA59DRAFT_181809 [Fusarium tricinctum]